MIQGFATHVANAFLGAAIMGYRPVTVPELEFTLTRFPLKLY